MPESIDELILAAMQRGEFDNLPNKGKKLNLDDYFDTPAELRLAYSVLKNSDFLPEEVMLLQEIASLQEKLAGISAAEEKRNLRRQIEDRRLKLNLLMERFARHRLV